MLRWYSNTEARARLLARHELPLAPRIVEVAYGAGSASGPESGDRLVVLVTGIPTGEAVSAAMQQGQPVGVARAPAL